MNTCKNCNQNFEGNFCNNCGQKASVGKIDYKYILHNLPNSFLQFNRGLLFTIRELTTRPASSIREFIAGKRQNHYQPIAYFILTSALYALVTFMLDKNTFLVDTLSGVIESLAKSDKSRSLEVINFLTKQQTYLGLLFIPLYSLASYFTFRKYKYNYFEHFVLNLYISAHQLLISTIFAVFIPDDSYFVLVAFTTLIIYNCTVLFQFFNSTPSFRKILLLLFTYLIYIVEYFLLIIILVALLSLFS